MSAHTQAVPSKCARFFRTWRQVRVVVALVVARFLADGLHVLRASFPAFLRAQTLVTESVFERAL